MQLKLEITPDLAAMMAAEIKAGERAISTATRAAGNTLKTAWRAQIADQASFAQGACRVRSG